MALLLALVPVKTSFYNPEAAHKEYQYWQSSHPFDCGMTILGYGKIPIRTVRPMER